VHIIWLKKCALSFTLVTLILILAFYGIAWYMLRPWPLPERLDVLLVSGGEGVRELYACQLRERYPNATIVMAAKPLMKDCLSLRTVIAESQSTQEEAEHFSRYLSGLEPNTGPLSVGLVTGPYHLRRAVYWVNRCITNPPISLYPVAVPMEMYGWRPDWVHVTQNYHLPRLVVREFMRLGYAHFK
jgi:uncharacterized SAM-binding protein YcdF (DUF218 family)